MPRLIIGKAGVVINVVNHVPDPGNGETHWVLNDDAQTVNVGDPFDIRDYQVDALDVVAMKALFRHENMIRQIIRTIRTNSALNTQATTNGLPTTANSPNLTAAEFRTAIKNIL